MEENKEIRNKGEKIILRALLCTFIVIMNFIIMMVNKVNTHSSPDNAAKPIIYIYSAEEQEVNVSL